MDNWCRFIQVDRDAGDLKILHFVRETKPQSIETWTTLSYYRLHFVTNGTGRLYTQTGDYLLQTGDLFFCAPTQPYALDSLEDFQYTYIGYIGTRANMLMDKLGVYGKNAVFQNCAELRDIWERAIVFPAEVLDLSAESVLLYSFATIGGKNFIAKKATKERNTLELVKKYMDEHFSDPELSLKTIGNAISYNPNYISAIFKNGVGVPFKEYLNTLRVHNACALMSKGITGVKDVAFLCGFNDPLYFSKVFKAHMGATPSDYANEIFKQNQKIGP